MEEKERYTVDFDGVIRDTYINGWENRRTAPPVKGSLKFVRWLMKYFNVAVCSAHAGTILGFAEICGWMWDNGFPVSEITIGSQKLPSVGYLDDRGTRFEGSFAKAKGQMFKSPWWKNRKK